MTIRQQVLEVPRKGQPIKAAEQAKLRAAVLALIREQPGLLTGLRHHLPAPALMLRLKSSNGDYWTCRQFDGATELDVDIHVAKPWELRPSVTAIGGQTYTYATDSERTADDGVSTETQVITLPWTIDETVLWAVRSDHTGVLGPSGEELVWLDKNVAARSWAKKFGT